MLVNKPALNYLLGAWYSTDKMTWPAVVALVELIDSHFYDEIAVTI